ncbi:hypothetical protein RO3G_16124 [Rhizopus delemar RA 99-880]|uniref:Tc1-like transposase DDE domain-containing protein n=1 Tax=Rhizopus delemar (strain RA 99-880 / ATCC MYA-4621 / FGSC 9543 / NRRL 43880) TaxID=246409 RepID=I1CSI3_RHIO9|nr:hypothetical protein RO3G_16124 [Rhizopus delemar RA 99-880]|eukprot:EIE91413.1 hypothetical protein RO3G_16124 [Rhizopus delemar RA 99-880]
MQHRLEWAKKHQDWTVEEWRKVVFSDETKINVWGSDGCKYYWKRPNDPLQPHHPELTVKHGAGKLMMWGCITSEGPGYACQIYDGNMNANVYRHILDTTLRDTMQYYNFNWSNIYFQHDNDPKHKAKSTMDWLDNHQVRYISDWSPQSPDLNPIEHVWHQLKLKLSCYERRAKNTDELWERVEKVWNGFDKELCQRA